MTADVAPIERIKQCRDDERELDDGRNGREHRGSNDGLDRIATALEHARQAAGLALQMKSQRELMQMHEYLDRQSLRTAFIATDANKASRPCWVNDMPTRRSP